MGKLIPEIKNDKKYHRRSIRLKGYDYSQIGAYFITICVHNRECLFGKIANDDITLNEYGIIAKNEWIKSSEIRKEIKLDEHIVMPNHIHGIIWIDNSVGANGRSPLQRTNMGPKTLSSFVAGYKSTVAKQINELRRLPGVSVWQRNYYDHVIRNEKELMEIREYIINNPRQWELDVENTGVGAQ
jgi:putative transposase